MLGLCPILALDKTTMSRSVEMITELANARTIDFGVTRNWNVTTDHLSV